MPTGEAPPCRRRRMLGPAVMGFLLLWAGVAWIAGVTLETSLAVALCIVGSGFVLGAFVGGAWALIAPAVLIGGTLLLVSAIDIPLSGPIGDRTWAPRSVVEVEESYELSIGESTLDLSDVRVDRGETLEIKASVGLGHLTVELPAGVEVDVTTRVGAGESNVFGVTNDGVSVSDRRVVEGEESAGTIELDLHVGMGQIEVDQIPASVNPEYTQPT